MHNNIIQRLEKISTKLFQESLKTFHLKDVIAHKKANPHTLVEMLSFYPNKGVGFQVFKKTWSPKLRIRITSAQFKVRLPISSPTGTGTCEASST